MRAIVTETAGPQLRRRLPRLHRASHQAFTRGKGIAAEARLARVAQHKGTIVAGPWLSEIGFELQYWIPMLRWFASRYGIPRERLLAISRGGPKSWYAGSCGAYADVLDHVAPDELRRMMEDRVAREGELKQFVVNDSDIALVHRILAAEGRDAGDVAVLHPALMYHRFRAYWEGCAAIHYARRRMEIRPFPALSDPAAAIASALPDEYIAVKVYFSACFPETPENRRFAVELIERLARERPVVLLSTGLALDDHSELPAGGSERVIAIDHLMRPGDNLEVQTEVIRGANAFFGTYGGFSYLPPFLGVSSFGFYSDDNFNQEHLALQPMIVRELQSAGLAGDFACLHTEAMRQLLSAGGVATVAAS